MKTKPVPAFIQAKQRIYLTQDRKTAVPEGHKDAHALLCAEGGMVLGRKLASVTGLAALVKRKAAKRKGKA